jgi:hypothetical protein
LIREVEVESAAVRRGLAVRERVIEHERIER